MADQPATLTEEEKARAIAWLNERAGTDFACSVCGTKDWYLAEHNAHCVGEFAFELRVIHGQKELVKGDGHMNIAATGVSSIALPALQIAIEEPGKLVFEFKENGQPWGTLVELPVVKI